MTLAAILIGVALAFAARPLAPVVSQDQQQAAPASSAPTAKSPAQAASPATQTPAAKSGPTSPAPGATQAPSGQKSPVAKHPARKRKVIPRNCDAASSVPSDANHSASNPSGAGSTNPSSGGNAEPVRSANCPPTKVVVPRGSSPEPTLQLAGGPGGDQAAQQRTTANQMLEAAAQNLKKIEGRNLTSDQQGMVNQIRQFMEQSKTATTAGDLDRARTLAWKAQLLSEELVNPQK